MADDRQTSTSDNQTIQGVNKPTAVTTNPATGDTQATPTEPPAETGGPQGLEPTRYGDWERNGRCTDF